MDEKPAKYAVQSEGDVIDLVLRHPLAWVVSAAGGFEATPLPMRPEIRDGKLFGLIGHFGRNNPQLAKLRAQPQALFLFMGMTAYMSPSWLADRTQAPTWNYMSAAFLCDLTFVEDEAGISDMLDDLVAANEAGRPKAWSIPEMGARYKGLARGIVGFTARILERQVVFKLGQDERDDVFVDIVAAMDVEGQGSLADLMRRYRPS